MIYGDTLRTPGFPFTVRELAPGERVDLGDGVTLEAHKVPHTAESVAYSVERGGARIVYTGDTAFDTAVAEWARGCDLLLCECSLPEQLAVATHLTPAQVGVMAEVAEPKRLVADALLSAGAGRRHCRNHRVAISRRGRDCGDGWSTEIEER